MIATSLKIPQVFASSFGLLYPKHFHQAWEPTLGLEGGTHMKILIGTAFLVAASAVACKPTETTEPPEAAKVMPTYSYGSQTPVYTPPVQPAASATPPCDATVNECAPDPKIVDLCKQQETDQTKCVPGIEKSLYETLAAKVAEAGSAAETTSEACKSTRYVNTEKTPLRVRDKPSTSGTAFDSVVRGGSLCVIGQVAGTGGVWLKINLDSKVGYVFAEPTSLTRPAALPAGGGSTGAGTPSVGTGLPNGGVVCSSGMFAARITNHFNSAPDYYPQAAADQSRVGYLTGGTFVCASNIVKTLQGTNVAMLLTYDVVKIQLAGKSNTDYYMECKYFEAAYKSKIGCN